MTRKNKDLLMRYLCMALPYGIICKCYHTEYDEWDGKPFVAEYDDTLTNIDAMGNCLGGGFSYDIEEVKPYLRPMSSMTEDEYLEYVRLVHEGYAHDTVDYLNSIHVDYRGLIEKGLALEAPDGMYNN